MGHTLTRMAGTAFDLGRVVAIVPRPASGSKRRGAPRVTVYLRDAVAVELTGDDARAFLDFVAGLPPRADGAEPALGPVGSRVAVGDAGAERGQRPGRKLRG